MLRAGLPGWPALPRLDLPLSALCARFDPRQPCLGLGSPSPSWAPCKDLTNALRCPMLKDEGAPDSNSNENSARRQHLSRGQSSGLPTVLLGCLVRNNKYQTLSEEVTGGRPAGAQGCAVPQWATPKACPPPSSRPREATSESPGRKAVSMSSGGLALWEPTGSGPVVRAQPPSRICPKTSHPVLAGHPGGRGLPKCPAWPNPTLCWEKPRSVSQQRGSHFPAQRDDCQA